MRQPPASSAIELEKYTRSVAQEVEYPQIRYVVPPTRMDGIPTGQAPRMRHDLGCQHFEWPDGTALSEPKLATEEQMHSLRACKSCVERQGRSGSTASRSARRDRYGELCPNCGLTLPLTNRVCDYCA